MWIIILLLLFALSIVYIPRVNNKKLKSYLLILLLLVLLLLQYEMQAYLLLGTRVKILTLLKNVNASINTTDYTFLQYEHKGC